MLNARRLPLPPAAVGLAAFLLSVLAGPARGAPADSPPSPGRAVGCPPPLPGSGEEDWTGQRAWQALERAGYRLGRLRIRVADVYPGRSLPWYQDLANTLHIDTRTEAVRAVLTVEAGAPVAAARIYEAERQLRSQDFLVEARLVPLRCAERRVDAEVRVRDAWTLEVGAGFGTAGGESTSSAQIREENLLGTGKTVFVGWKDGRERRTEEFGYLDPAVLGSPWAFGVTHRELTDGHGDSVALTYPFRRIDQAWGLRAQGEDLRQEVDFEQAGEKAYTARMVAERARLELRRLVALAGQAGWRVGVGWERDYAVFGPLADKQPELRAAPALTDRRLQGPYVVVERFSDRYNSFRNVRAIGITEDYNLGLEARLLAGRYTDGIRDDRPWFGRAELSYGAKLAGYNLFLADLSLSGRRRSDGNWVANYRSFAWDYYHRNGLRNRIVVHGGLDWQEDPDPEDELYLGGFDGLMGYPGRFRVGNRRWLLHLEDRFTSDLILLDTVQVGFTAFAEAGNIRGLDGEWGETLADVGAGLRLGIIRSSSRSALYLAVAVPLVDAGTEEEYQPVIGSTLEF